MSAPFPRCPCGKTERKRQHFPADVVAMVSNSFNAERAILACLIRGVPKIHLQIRLQAHNLPKRRGATNQGWHQGPGSAHAVARPFRRLDLLLRPRILQRLLLLLLLLCPCRPFLQCPPPRLLQELRPRRHHHAAAGQCERQPGAPQGGRGAGSGAPGVWTWRVESSDCGAQSMQVRAAGPRAARSGPARSRLPRSMSGSSPP